MVFAYKKRGVIKSICLFFIIVSHIIIQKGDRKIYPPFLLGRKCLR